MRWKLIVGILAFLVVGTLLAVYLVVTNYDYNQLKPRISRAVQEATGRKLTLDGDIGLKFGLQPSLVVAGVALQNADWGTQPQMVRLERLELKLALLPLLQRKIDIRHLILVKPEILVETDAQGRSNLAFGPAAAAETSEPAAEAEPGAAQLPDLVFGQLRIDQGTFTLRDGRTGQTMVVRLESLTARGGTGQEPLEVALKGRYNDIDLEARIKGGPLAALLDAKQTWPLEVTATGPETTLTVEGSITDTMAVKGIDLNIALKVADLAKLAVKLKPLVPQIDLSPLAGSLSVAAKVKAADRTNISLSDIQITADTPEANLAISGSVVDALAVAGIELDTRLKVTDVAELGRRLKISPPPLTGPVEFSSRLSIENMGAMALENIKLLFDGSDLTGNATVALAGSKPALTAALKSTRLDLRPLMGTGTAGVETAAAKSAAKTPKERVFPDTPLPLEPLGLADADLTLTVVQLLLPRVALDNLKLKVLLKNGHLQLTPLTARVGGGSLDANIDARVGSKGLDLKFGLKVDNLNLGQMLKELEITDLMEGILDADIDLSANGGSVAALMAGMNGHSQMAVESGVIYNKSVNVLGIELVSTLLNMINPLSTKKENTLVNCMVSRFDIRKGIAKSTALVLDTDMMSLAGDGQLDLGTEALDFSIDPAPKKGVGVSGIGSVGLGLGELAKPFKLTGTLAKPGIGLDVGQAALMAGKVIGGIALTGGTSGIVAALASGKTAGEENPCMAALEAAAKGELPAASQTSTETDTATTTTEKVTESATEGLKSVGGALKGLFGD